MYLGNRHSWLIAGSHIGPHCCHWSCPCSNQINMILLTRCEGHPSNHASAPRWCLFKTRSMSINQSTWRICWHFCLTWFLLGLALIWSSLFFQSDPSVCDLFIYFSTKTNTEMRREPCIATTNIQITGIWPLFLECRFDSAALEI